MLSADNLLNGEKSVWSWKQFLTLETVYEILVCNAYGSSQAGL